MSNPTGLICHEFALVLDRAPITEDEWEWLGDVAHDAGFTIDAERRGAVAEFDRAAPDLAEAIATAIRDLTTAGFTALGVLPVELVLSTEICDRTELGWPAINVRVTQSPATHPKPSATGHPTGGAAGPDGFYRWSEIAAWLAAHGIPQTYDRTIAAAHAMVLAGGIEHLTPAQVADRIRAGVA